MKHLEATEEIRETAALHALGALDAEEAASLRAHLDAGCEVCRVEIERLAAVVAAFDADAPPLAPPASLRERVLAVTREGAAARRRPATLKTMLPPGLLAQGSAGSPGGWVERSPGVRSRVLHVDPSSGRVTSLLRIDAGARIPTHDHVGVEEVFMIDGDCRIEPERVIHAGDYYRAEPGTRHGPASSEGGAIFLSVALNRYVAGA